MMRFFRLYKTFVVQQLKQLMEYRVDFLTGATSFLVGQITNIVFISIIFSQIPHLQGFDYYEIIFIYGFSLVPKGIDHLFTDNLWKVAWFIVRKGNFDKYLTRPINPLLHVIMETLQFDALGELLTGIVLMIIASIKLGINYRFGNVALMLLAFAFGTVIYAAIKIAGAALALWIKSSGSILQVFYMSSDFAKYPVTIYNSAVRNIITYIVPFAFTAYYPASYILRGNDPWFCFGVGTAIAAVLLTLAILLWNRGLRAYESAGS
ncbi:MAG: ABC-2 family transporter protein [Lachnospiraceae bacterium]|nr:ABC-2 family transporter protein [Lachnospiraceae bacterium]